jgi:undecaprenyl-phosphate 4-deoxy-4-formamido-L-arabinose transferase
MKYSVVIPCFRGSDTIPVLFDQIKSVFKQINSEFEVIFVFDGGEITAWDAIKKIVSDNPEIVKGVRLSRNFGQHNATICGFKYVSGDFIVTMDEDLQHSPADIPTLIKKQNEFNFDLVYGQYIQRQHSFFRNFTSEILNKLLRYGIPDLHPDYTSFRLIKTSIAKETLSMNNSYTFLDGYLAWITKNVSSVNVKHFLSESLISSYSLNKLFEHSINIFVTFSNLPIRLLIKGSFLFMIFSLIYGGYNLFRKVIYDDMISGFATFSVLGSFGLAIILMALGIIGEYIFRINLKTTKRPNFKESEIV